MPAVGKVFPKFNALDLVCSEAIVDEHAHPLLQIDDISVDISPETGFICCKLTTFLYMLCFVLSGNKIYIFYYHLIFPGLDKVIILCSKIEERDENKIITIFTFKDEKGTMEIYIIC